MNEKLNKLITTFKDASFKQHEYTLEGNWRKGNAQAKRIATAFEKLREEGNEGREALLFLTDSDELEIALNAAVFSLKYNPKKCLKILEMISKKDIPLISSGAKQTIDNWKNGDWQLE